MYYYNASQTPLLHSRSSIIYCARFGAIVEEDEFHVPILDDVVEPQDDPDDKQSRPARCSARRHPWKTSSTTFTFNEDTIADNY
jgi:hypothetical protein